MGYVIRMPKLGLEMEEGTVLEWTADVGEDVSEGEKIAEVESEKSIGEVEAREDGVVREVYVGVDETVPPSTPIGIFAAPDADTADLEAEAEADLEDEVGSEATEGATEEAEPDAPEATAGGGAGGSTAGSPEDVRASPRAEKRAEELGVDLTAVEGTGPQGAITADDVEAAEQAQAEPEPENVRASPRAEKRAEELGVDLTAVEGTGPQGAITADDVEAAEQAQADTGAAAAGEARRIEPGQAGGYRYRQVTAVADPAAATGLLETTEAVRTAFEERVTVTDVLVVVASAALSDCPAMNATYAESTHQFHDGQNVALATTEDGELVTGVVPDVASRSLTDIVEARQELGGEGGRATFTLAVGEDADADSLLVNPPGVASLAVDPSGQRAVPGEDGVDLQPLVTATLTYDTRALGHGAASAFLEQLFEHARAASELALGSYRGTE